MKKYVDALFDSMVRHDTSILPLTPRYKATENSRPAALKFMEAWRTITAVKKIGHLFQDPTTRSVFFVATVDEHGMSALVWGRLKIEGELISEVEISIGRSRGDSGFVSYPDEFAEGIPDNWTKPIPEGTRATRAELQRLGEAVFDKSYGDYPAAEGVYIMEQGGIVYEDAGYADKAFGGMLTKDAGPIKPGVTFPLMCMGMDFMRPNGINPRILCIDEEQGVVAVASEVQGETWPYLIATDNATAYIPLDMKPLHDKTLTPDLFEGISAFTPMPATNECVELYRYFDGKVQGNHRLMQIQGPGARSPWNYYETTQA
jgi:hypothetical protein